MQVRLVRPIAFRKVGTVLDVPDGVAELWILQRKAERIVAEPSRVECMVPVRTLDVSFRPRKQRVAVA